MSAVDPVALSRIVRLADFEPLAREALGIEIFDYVAGGSWDEISLAENVAAWQRRRLRPRVLVDVARRDDGDDDARGAVCDAPRDRADGGAG